MGRKNYLKKKGREISIKEGCAYGVQEGFGLKNVTPYALAVGFTNFHIGLLHSVPSFLGNLSQLFTFNAMSKYSRKKLVFFGVLLQAIMWLFMIGVGYFYFYSDFKEVVPFSLIIIYSLLFLFDSFVGPAWTSWMKDLVPRERGHYFGRRNEIIGFVAIVSMLIAGFILDYFKKTNLFYGFIVLFFVAFLFRSISAFLFLKQYEPKFKPDKKYYFSFKQFIGKMFHNNFGKFVVFLALVNFATTIAAPFFAVYILKNLGFSYITFFIINISSLSFSLIMMPYWGRKIDKYGSVKIMKLTGFFTPFIPLLWFFSPLFSNLPVIFLISYLFLVEIFSGIFWAGFNLAGGNFIYDAVTKEKISLCIAYSNILSGVGVFLGSILGGSISSLKFNFLNINSILFVFLISSVVRMLVYISMIHKIHEVRKVKHLSMKERFFSFKFVNYFITYFAKVF